MDSMSRSIRLFPKLDMKQQQDSIQKMNITFEERDKYTDLHLVSLSHFKIGPGQVRPRKYRDFKAPSCLLHLIQKVTDEKTPRKYLLSSVNSLSN